MSHPPTFYKYLSPEAANAVLSTGRLRWSSPLTFDDPSEFRRMPRFEPSVAESYQSAVEVLLSAAIRGDSEFGARLSPGAGQLYRVYVQALGGGLEEAELRSAADDAAHSILDPDRHIADGLDSWVTSLRVETARVLCVSVDPDNDDLWQRYAADHSGVVLTLRHIEERSTPLLAARPISYMDRPAVVGSGVDFLLFGDTVDLRRRTFDGIFMTKTSEWSSQHEWRALTWRPDEKALFGDYRFYPEELAAVTWGRNAIPSFRLAMEQLVRSRFPDARAEPVATDA